MRRPSVRHIVGGCASQPEKMAASSSELGRFETEMLASPRNLTTLMNLPGEWVDSVSQRQPLKKLILDMDSSISETYGNQQGAAYNAHFECCCYHPLFLFNQFGDVERVMLRRGNHASAKYWRRVLLPVIARYDHCQIPKFFRGDAAFAEPALYDKLEQSGYRYAIRLKSNPVLERRIARLLVRPVGRPSRRPKVFYVGSHYQAKSWDRKRRVVAKVERHANELFPRVGFIVTNLPWQARKVVKFVAPVERRSNGSRRARMPSGGLGSPARPSGQTTLVCNSSPWRTTSGTSSAGWHFQRACGSGR